MYTPRSMAAKKPASDAPARPVTQMLVGWLDGDGVLRQGAKRRLMSEREALELLSDDIDTFGEPSPPEAR